MTKATTDSISRAPVQEKFPVKDISKDTVEEKTNPSREEYIQYLRDSGVSGEKLQKSIEAIDKVDVELNNLKKEEAWRRLKEKTDEHIKKEWAIPNSIELENITEEEFDKIVSAAIKELRRRRRKEHKGCPES